MTLPHLVDGLANGDEIIAVIWFHVGQGAWMAAPFQFEDHLDKLRLAYRLGEVVEQNGYDALVLFTMAWCGSTEEVPPVKGGLTDMEAMENKSGGTCGDGPITRW